MKYFNVLTFVVGFCLTSRGQTLFRPLSATTSQLNAYNPNSADAFSFAANQASLGSIKHLSAALYAENRFLLHELSWYQASIALPTSGGDLGCVLHYYGNSNYNESLAGIAYARKFDKIELGAQFDFVSVHQAIYGQVSTECIEAGIIFHLTDNFEAGFHAFNPTGSQWAKVAEKLPIVFSTGFGYVVSENLFFGSEVQKNLNEPLDLKSGLNYSFDPRISAGFGIETAPSIFFFETAVRFNDIDLKLSASVHPSLGITPGLLIIYKAH